MTTMAVVEEPMLVQLTRGIEEAEQVRKRLGAEVERADAELPGAREALARVRAELGEQMRSGVPAKDLRSLKAAEASAALQVETTEAFVAGRRQVLQEATRVVERARESLRREQEGVNALRAGIREQEVRVSRGRQAIAADEADLAHRRTLLAGEERTLKALRSQLERLEGPSQAQP